MATPALRIIRTGNLGPVKSPSLPVGRKATARLVVVHSLNHTPAQARILREVTNPKYSAYERDYLEWYHNDPLKRNTHRASTHSSNNGAELLASKRCGCFSCEAIFSPFAITEWIRDSQDRTGCCPECGMDTVIGDASGYPIIPEFLRAMGE